MLVSTFVLSLVALLAVSSSVPGAVASSALFPDCGAAPLKGSPVCDTSLPYAERAAVSSQLTAHNTLHCTARTAARARSHFATAREACTATHSERVTDLSPSTRLVYCALCAVLCALLSGWCVR